ncbi:hypothetical protein LCGC14_0678620 [marine sediment metagenome]|uniref:Uncharacterized protein n=1 Tax=marine sediment metagenome TaxID=412755 RepID=A0A0F9R943_9ZZZZ
MAITYPLALPTVGLFVRFSLTTQSANAESVSPFTFERQIQTHQGMLWLAGITLAPMKRASAEEWRSFFLKLNGKQGTFLMGDLGAKFPRGIAAGTPLVDGAGQTGQELDTKGWTTEITGILKAGDYIQIGTGLTSRLYKNLNDVNSDSGGLATLDIWPRLRESPANSAVIVVSEPKGLFRLSSNLNLSEVGISAFYGFGFSAIEAL